MRANIRAKFQQIALPYQFLDAGALPTLHDRYGISTSAIVGPTQKLAGVMRLKSRPATARA